MDIDRQSTLVVDSRLFEQSKEEVAGTSTSGEKGCVFRHRKQGVRSLEDIPFEEFVAVCTCRRGRDGGLRGWAKRSTERGGR